MKCYTMSKTIKIS